MQIAPQDLAWPYLIPRDTDDTSLSQANLLARLELLILLIFLSKIKV